MKKSWQIPSQCCEAKKLIDERWDTYYCSECLRWLEPVCDCSKEDFDAGECHIDKWSKTRPPRFTS